MKTILSISLAALCAGTAIAQDAPDMAAGAAQAVMMLDGTAPDADAAAVTGWHVCDVTRTGAGWGNHYAALTCPNGPFTDKWHIISAAQKDQMLATALAALASGKQVQVYIGAQTGGYQELLAFYAMD